jgi:hypothetical protein
MLKHYKHCLSNKFYVSSFVAALVFLSASLVINFYAGTYATQMASNPVTDIILDNIPVFDVDGIFVWGAIIFVGCIVLVCLSHPHRIPFTLKTISLFVVVRSLFISLTHIAPSPTQVMLDPLSWTSNFIFGGDLFFSGHTGLPFLLALLFWDNKKLRISFISLSVILGSVSLMGHLHYSIDVFAAFFITYGIYCIAEQIFKRDKILGERPLAPEGEIVQK